MNNFVDFAQEMPVQTQTTSTPERVEQEAATASEDMPLRDTIRSYLETYITDLGGEPPKNLYKKMLNLIEKPMLVGIMKYTRNNQSRAAKLLNISRGTLRKKLKIYDLL